MKTGRGIGIGLLLAALGAGTAAGDGEGRVRGVLKDGTQNYSEAAFARLEKVEARRAKGDRNDPESGKTGPNALTSITCPLGPIAGARVTVRSLGESPEARETATDAEGRFQFEGLADGEYVLTVRRPGKGFRGPRELSWRFTMDELGRQVEADLAWPDKYLVARGKVVDSAGKPLAGRGSRRSKTVVSTYLAAGPKRRVTWWRLRRMSAAGSNCEAFDPCGCSPRPDTC